MGHPGDREGVGSSVQQGHLEGKAEGGKWLGCTAERLPRAEEGAECCRDRPAGNP